MTDQDNGFHSGGSLDPCDDGAAGMPFARPEADRIRPGCEKPPVLTVYLARHFDPGRLGHQYDAIFRGELIATSHDPEFAAARVLRDRGYSGRLQFFRLFMSGPEPALIMKDLVHSADYCATPDGRFRKWQPFDARRDPVGSLAAQRSSADTNAPE